MLIVVTYCVYYDKKFATIIITIYVFIASSLKINTLIRNSNCRNDDDNGIASLDNYPTVIYTVLSSMDTCFLFGLWIYILDVDPPHLHKFTIIIFTYFAVNIFIVGILYGGYLELCEVIRFYHRQKQRQWMEEQIYHLQYRRKSKSKSKSNSNSITPITQSEQQELDDQDEDEDNNKNKNKNKNIITV